MLNILVILILFGMLLNIDSFYDVNCLKKTILWFEDIITIEFVNNKSLKFIIDDKNNKEIINEFWNYYIYIFNTEKC